MLTHVTHFLQHTLAPICINALFPPRCALCDAPTDSSPQFCTTCFAQLHIISDPMCYICGRSFEHAMGNSDICIPCQTDAPAFDRARAALHYDEHSRTLITRIKFGDRTDLTTLGARLMGQAGSDLLAHTDLILPVPCIGADYSLANSINPIARYSSCRNHNIPCAPYILKRTRATAPQTLLDFNERQHNVKDAFRIPPKHAHLIKGKRILLIDDVFTTGATITACTEALKKARASQVFVLTLARRMPTD